MQQCLIIQNKTDGFSVVNIFKQAFIVLGVYLYNLLNRHNKEIGKKNILLV